MELPKYDILAEDDLYTFRFISDGKNGKIQKKIQYQKNKC